MSYQKLKPCPFCGGKARFMQRLDPETYKAIIAVVCTNPDCQASSGRSKVRAEVVRAWNKRVGERDA